MKVLVADDDSNAADALSTSLRLAGHQVETAYDGESALDKAEAFRPEAAILDIRMQSRNMTDQEALDLMEKKAFQTGAEAEGKLRRAKLTAGQLITYYVGYHQWIDLRDGIQREQGSEFSLK